MPDNNLDIIEDPNAPKKAQDQGTQPPAGTGQQAPSGATGPSGGAGAGPQQASTGKTGSGFVNLQNVLNANKQGGQNLGNAVGSGIQQAASDVNSNIGQGQSQFQQQSAAGSVGGQSDIDSRNAILNKISGYTGAPGTENAGGAGNFDEKAQTAPPTTVNGVGQGPGVQSTTIPGLPIGQSDIDAFSKYRNGSYTGPQQLSNYDQLSQQAQQAQQLGQNVSSTGGQQALLQQFIGQNNPNYNRGMQSLDQLLMGQGGMNPLQQARQATMGLGAKVQGAEQGAEGQAALAAANSAQFGKDTTSLLGSAGTDATTGKGLIGDYTNKIYGDLASKQGNADADYKNFQQRLNTNQLTQDDIDKYIVPNIGGTNLFGKTGADLAAGFNEGKYRLENVSDPTQYAKIQALQKLAGTQDVNAFKLDPTKFGSGGPSIAANAGSFDDLQKKAAGFTTAQGQQLQPLQDMLSQAKLRENTLTGLDTSLKTQVDALKNKQYGEIQNPNDPRYGMSPDEQRNQDIQQIYSSTIDKQRPDLKMFDPRLLDVYSNYKPTQDETGAWNTGGPMSGGGSYAQDYAKDEAALRQQISAEQARETTAGGGSISSLMSPDAKAAYDTAHQYKEGEAATPDKAWDVGQYNAAQNKYNPNAEYIWENTEHQGSGGFGSQLGNLLHRAVPVVGQAVGNVIAPGVDYTNPVGTVGNMIMPGSNINGPRLNKMAFGGIVPSNEDLKFNRLKTIFK